MDKKYIELFNSLARATSVLAEQVMDYDKTKEDEKGYAAAESMRNDYQELTFKIKDAGDNYILDKMAAARLLIAAMIQVNQLQNQINGLKNAMTGYQTDIIPKLQDIVDNAKDDEAVFKWQMKNLQFQKLNI